MLNQSSEYHHARFFRPDPTCRSIGAIRALPLILSFFSATVVAQTKASDCQCRAPDGQMRDLGYVQCVDIVGQRNLVRCVMSTNTPYWKKLDDVEGCPAA